MALLGRGDPNTQSYKSDPLDFDRKCDGALPLEEMIAYVPALRKLFEDIDRKKVRVWGLTNAYRLVSCL